MSSQQPPRYDRRQVVKNLTVAFGGLARTYLLALDEMGFRGAEGLRIVREAMQQAAEKEVK